MSRLEQDPDEPDGDIENRCPRLCPCSQPSTTAAVILVLVAPPCCYLALPPACSYSGITRCAAACSSEMRVAADGAWTGIPAARRRRRPRPTSATAADRKSTRLN